MRTRNTGARDIVNIDRSRRTLPTASVFARCMHARTKSFIARGLTTIASTFLAWCKASANSKL